MDILEQIRQRAAARPQHIVLPEGDDPRTVIAAAACAQRRIARITLLGDEGRVRDNAQSERVDLGGVEVIDHRRAPDFEKVVSLFHDLRRAKGMMTDEARTTLKDPLYYGNLMVRMGRADGSVARALPDSRSMASFRLMPLCCPRWQNQRRPARASPAARMF